MTTIRGGHQQGPLIAGFHCLYGGKRRKGAGGGDRILEEGGGGGYTGNRVPNQDNKPPKQCYYCLSQGWTPQPSEAELGTRDNCCDNLTRFWAKKSSPVTNNNALDCLKSQNSIMTMNGKHFLFISVSQKREIIRCRVVTTSKNCRKPSSDLRTPFLKG